MIETKWFTLSWDWQWVGLGIDCYLGDVNMRRIGIDLIFLSIQIGRIL
jgi:hypothetical protein